MICAWSMGRRGAGLQGAPGALRGWRQTNTSLRVQNHVCDWQDPTSKRASGQRMSGAKCVLPAPPSHPPRNITCDRGRHGSPRPDRASLLHRPVSDRGPPRAARVANFKVDWDPLRLTVILQKSGHGQDE